MESRRREISAMVQSERRAISTTLRTTLPARRESFDLIRTG
jgi:hypothetical protein